MLGRALSLATVTLLTGWFAIGLAAVSPVWAQTQNLEAGKSPSQIFAGTCTACHKSPRGLLKTVAPGSLAGFLRQHYTTSSDMASTLSSYLVSNGATDTRGGRDKPSTEPKPSEARSGAGSDQPDRQGRKMRSQEAAKPDADGSAPSEPARQGRKRLARPGEGPDETKPAADGQAPVQVGDDRKLSSKRLSKRGRPGGEEQPKPDTAKSDEAPKAEPAKEDKPKGETAREDSARPEVAKPAGEAAKSEAAKSEPAKPEPAKSESAKTDNSGAPPVLRADPVPPVTPAPAAPAAPSAAVSSAAPAPQPAVPAAPAPAAAPPAVTASAPPPPPAPVNNAGPPAPPISQ